MDYYAVLGVARDAEAIVIQAAYKALVRKYHPDVFSGQKALAEEKIREINEAYETLSATSKKASYDQTLSNQDGGIGDYERYNEDEELASIVHERDWALLLEYYPDAEKRREQLASISAKAAIYYQIVLLELKAGSKYDDWADIVQKHFMERYFGSSSEIHSLVYALLKIGRKDLAVGINQAIRVLGDDSADDIAANFRKKHGSLFTAKHVVTAPPHPYNSEPATLFWYGLPGDVIIKGQPIFHIKISKTGKLLIIKAERRTTIMEVFKKDGYQVKKQGEELGLISN